MISLTDKFLNSSRLQSFKIKAKTTMTFFYANQVTSFHNYPKLVIPTETDFKANKNFWLANFKVSLNLTRFKRKNQTFF